LDCCIALPFKFLSGSADNAPEGRMLIFWRRGGAILALGALLILGLGVAPLWADGMDKASARDGSDLRQFGEEFRASGALKFYEDTEDLLRAGKFERAFCRYLFLKANIRGQALYVGLNTMVDWRLHCLKSQLRLGEEAFYTVPDKKLKIRIRRQARRVPPPSPPPPETKTDKTPTPPAVTPAAAKATGPESQAPAPSPAEKPAELIIPPPVTADQVKTSPNEEKKSPGEEVQEEKPKEKKPAPPPSAWDKIKRRLKFW
jgi:hypothetical protein